MIDDCVCCFVYYLWDLIKSYWTVNLSWFKELRNLNLKAVCWSFLQLFYFEWNNWIYHLRHLNFAIPINSDFDFVGIFSIQHGPRDISYWSSDFAFVNVISTENVNWHSNRSNLRNGRRSHTIKRILHELILVIGWRHWISTIILRSDRKPWFLLTPLLDESWVERIYRVRNLMILDYSSDWRVISAAFGDVTGGSDWKRVIALSFTVVLRLKCCNCARTTRVSWATFCFD